MRAKAAIPIRKMPTKYHNQNIAYQDFLLKAKGRCLKHSIYKKRTVVERFFASLKQIYNLGKNKKREELYHLLETLMLPVLLSSYLNFILMASLIFNFSPPS